MSESLIGDRLRYFGEYLVLGEIASGGMGTVYRARQESLNRTIALKVIRGGALANRAAIERFRIEAEAAASLDHPNIVPIYEIGEQEGQQYFSMKFVDGESLADALKERLFPAIAAARIVATLARAVAHAHERGVLHRDLKPANVLLDEHGQPHLTDFGLAKLLDSSAGQTRTEAVLGTPEFMSPEQASGRSRDVTTATDVYGLGAILFSLLTGHPPFQGATPIELTRKVVEEEPRFPSPSSRGAKSEQDVRTISIKCLQKDSALRYRSALALAEDLERWLRGEPIEARPVSGCERAWKWVKRHPVTASLIAAVVVSILAGSAGITWQWRRAEFQRRATTALNGRLQLQRAEDLFAADETPLALATLARTIRDDPSHQSAAERLSNALRQRSYLLPSTEPPATNTDDLQQSFRSAHSGDDAFRVTATNAASIQLWRVVDGALLLTLVAPHEGVIRSVAFSRDGARFVSSASDGTAKLWFRETGRLAMTLAHPDAVNCTDFSADGARLVTACRDGAARVWEVVSGQLLVTSPHGAPLNSARFDASGQWLITATAAGDVRLWNSATGQSASERLRLGVEVLDSGFVANSRHVKATLITRSVLSFAWTVPELVTIGLPVQSFPSPRLLGVTNILGDPASQFHAQEVTSYTVSADGTLLATASADLSARVWDARTKAPRSDPLMHSAVVSGVAFSPDGRHLATSSADRRARLWDCNTGTPLSDWIEFTKPVAGISFSAAGTELVTFSGERWLLFVPSSRDATWLADAAEAVAGFRLTEARLAEPLSRERMISERRRLLKQTTTLALPAWAVRLLDVQ